MDLMPYLELILLSVSPKSIVDAVSIIIDSTHILLRFSYGPISISPVE